MVSTRVLDNLAPAAATVVLEAINSNIKQIETDFGLIGIELEADMPTSAIGIYEMSVLRPVFQPVPEKGNLFYEPLAKSGAVEKGQIYGKIGLEHGPGHLHGSITGLATS